MHHFIREGGGSPKSLPLVQSPGAQTNKEDIKNLHSEREGNCLPSVVPTQFQGQWRHTTTPGQSLPYCNPQHAHIFFSSHSKPPVSH